jgi:hypothetical protein
LLLLKLFGRVVNYVLTLGILGFGWYQDPKLVKAAFQWNASLLEKATDRFNPSGHVEGILLANGALWLPTNHEARHVGGDETETGQAQKHLAGWGQEGGGSKTERHTGPGAPASPRRRVPRDRKCSGACSRDARSYLNGW